MWSFPITDSNHCPESGAVFVQNMLKKGGCWSNVKVSGHEGGSEKLGMSKGCIQDSPLIFTVTKSIEEIDLHFIWDISFL